MQAFARSGMLNKVVAECETDLPVTRPPFFGLSSILSIVSLVMSIIFITCIQ